MTRLHYLTAILRAEAAGFPHLARALWTLYLRDYPYENQL